MLVSNNLSLKYLVFKYFLVGADSLEYLSVDGLVKAVRWDIKIKKPGQIGHCTACLTGEYPGGIPEELDW